MPSATTSSMVLVVSVPIIRSTVLLTNRAHLSSLPSVDSMSTGSDAAASARGDS